MLAGSTDEARERAGPPRWRTRERRSVRSELSADEHRIIRPVIAAEVRIDSELYLTETALRLHARQSEIDPSRGLLEILREFDWIVLEIPKCWEPI